VLLTIMVVNALDTFEGGYIDLLLSLPWTILFGIMLYKVLSKIRRGGHKGRSSIYINILIWLTPCMIPLLFLSFMACLRVLDICRIWFDDYYVIVFWADLAAMIPLMWLMSFMIRKWRSIADE
jgi:predicted neutral ceramidase superfamily lipid hydrolase